jgi:transcription elongation GreA/GreB family factor
VKDAIRDELLRSLREALATAEAAYAAAIEGATHSEAKAENDKDTRALEQSYVARGQAMRVDELRAGVAEVEKLSLAAAKVIASGSLVTVEDDEGETRRYFVAPAGGGTTLARGKVQVVTPKSPLGRALCGKRVDDETEVAIAGATRTLTVTRVE